MSSPVIRFEVVLPLAQQGTPDFTALKTFQTTIEGLSKSFYYQVIRGSDELTMATAFFGYITSAQSANALAALATLNSSLSSGPVLCVSWPATSQP